MREAIKSAGKVFTPQTGRSGPITPEIQAKARQQLEAFDTASRTGVRKCLTKDEVYYLGWFSFLEDMGTDCRVGKTDALKSYRYVDDLDSDLINGAAKWEKVEGDVSNLIFFKGQGEARAVFSRENDRRRQAALICDDMLRGFGPSGDKFPGLVRRQ